MQANKLWEESQGRSGVVYVTDVPSRGGIVVATSHEERMAQPPHLMQAERLHYHHHEDDHYHTGPGRDATPPASSTVMPSSSIWDAREAELLGF